MTSTWILALFVVSVSGGSLENRLRRQLGDDCQLLNWQPFNGNEYGFFDHTKSFTAAEGICMRCQATVASITNNEELTFLRNLVPHGTPFWLGATDRGTEGQFEWLDGSAMTFTNWKHGEPDNLNTDESNEADCAYVNANGLWRDNHCDLDNKRFVCKKRGVVATTVPPTTTATTAPLVLTTVSSQPSAAPAVEPAPSAEQEGSEPTFQILPVFVTDGPQPVSASLPDIYNEEIIRSSPRPTKSQVSTVTNATPASPPLPPTTTEPRPTIAIVRPATTAQVTTTVRRQTTTTPRPTPTTTRRSVWSFVRGALDNVRSRFRWFGKRR